MGNSGKATGVEMAVCCVAAVIMSILVLKLTGRAFDFPMAERARSSAVIAICILLAMAAAAAVNIYAVPHIKNLALARWIPAAACVLVLLAAVIPLAMFMLKSNYLQTLVAMLISIGAAAGIVMLVHGLFGMLAEGDKDFKKTKERTDTINQILDK